MKTILVLTDFSINAAYTAQYALGLAQNIEANLLLCNIYEEPLKNSTAAKKQWMMGNAEEDSIQDLGAVLGHLKKGMDKAANLEKFRPDIEQCSKEGLVGDKFNAIAADRHILMAVISMHGAGFLATLLAGNHAGRIIENARFPVLIIPYQVRFKPFKTIAFASALNYSDIHVLQALSGLAIHSKSEILVAHVDNDDTESEGSVKQFFNQIPLKISYPKILYRNIKSRDIITGLKLLIARADVGLLVMVHHKSNFLRKLLNGSIVQRMALQTTKPLLILPGTNMMDTLPVF